MSEILRGGNSHLEGTWDKRGIIPKTRMLLTALAASTMLMGGPQASAQTQTTEDGKARIEMREKQENVIIPLIGNQGVREYFYANNSELPMLPQSAELKWSEIYPQIKDGKWDITEHPASYFFMSNNNSSTFTLDGLGEIYSIDGDYREKISDNPYKIRFWGPTYISIDAGEKDYAIVINQVGNLCVEEPNTQGSTVPEVRELKAKEEIYMLSEPLDNSLVLAKLEKRLGKKIFSSDTKITIPGDNLVTGFFYGKPNEADINNRSPKTYDNTGEDGLGINGNFEYAQKILKENNISVWKTEKIEFIENGLKYSFEVAFYLLKTTSGDGSTFFPRRNEIAPLTGKTIVFGEIANLKIETPINKITPSIEIKNPEMGSISLLNEKNEEVSELEEGKKYTLKADPKKGYQLSYLKLNDSIQTTNPVTFTCGKVVKIEAAFEKIETPIEKITPTVEITGTGEGTTTFLDENGTPVTELEVGKKYTINISAAPKSEIKNITLNNTDISITNTSNMEYSFTCEKPCEWIITINKITSNNEVNNTFRIATQPGKLILSTQNPQAVQVYDMNGTLKYYNRNLQGEEHLNLPTGIYLIKTEQGSQKVIIQ